MLAVVEEEKRERRGEREEAVRVVEVALVGGE
jgi:hypothetical protein